MPENVSSQLLKNYTDEIVQLANKNKINIEQMFIMLCIYEDNLVTLEEYNKNHPINYAAIFQNLIRKEILKKNSQSDLLLDFGFVTSINDCGIVLTEKGKELCNIIKSLLLKNIKETVPLKSGIIDTVANELTEDWIMEYRKLFSQAASHKIGIMGDKKAAIEKMKTFFKEYPQFADKDLIMKSAKYYIQSCSKDNYKYLQQADYVIFKQEVVKGGNRVSRLASLCEEVLEKGDTPEVIGNFITDL